MSTYPIFLEFPDASPEAIAHLTKGLQKQFGSSFAGTTHDGRIWFVFESASQFLDFRAGTHLAYRMSLGIQTYDTSTPASTVSFRKQGRRYIVQSKKT